MLAVAAVRRWSPLVVLTATVLSATGGLVSVFVTALAETCGPGTAANAAEWTGAVLLGLGLGAWGVRRGAHALWAIPAGWLLAAAWVSGWAHVLPGGGGACFN